MTSRQSALLAILLFLSTSLFAQGLPTATLTGRVTSDGTPLPGVTVSVTSPNLQGTRTTVTTENGDYILPLLPPGQYTVRFELQGLQTITRTTTLTAARSEPLDVALRPEAMTEAITVTAATPVTAAIESTQVSTNFGADLIEVLPVGRTLNAVTLLAPGVNSNGPGGNTVISGAMSFDSVYLVNGAIVNENLRGQPHNLFIEDAIQETTVMTAGISAEYGNFTGGVVNAITKSGGNEFKGSLRSSLTNESWTEPTALTLSQEDKINPVYSGTLGGPILRDRIWFFGAGRMSETEDVRQTVMGGARAGDHDLAGNPYVQCTQPNPNNPLCIGTPLTPITYPHGTEEQRIEGKLTGNITNRHSIVASYLDIAASETNQTGQSIMDLDSLVAERETPNTFAVLNYNGTLTNTFFAEAQYSKKDFQFVGSGSPYHDIIKGTLITDRARGTRYWSPTFRATPQGEERDIRTWTVRGTYFLSSQRAGSHELKLGYEDFNEVRAVNNYQNGSDYRISVPNTIVRGHQVFPRMPGGATGNQTRISWLPIFTLSQGSDYTTRSVYLNDRWNLSDRWSFNLGVRYDQNDAISGDGTMQIADDATWSPRLAAHYDLFGTGRLVFNATYGQYLGRLAEGAANDVDPAGRNASLQWDYRGPSINNDPNVPTSQLIPTDQAIKMVMDWFFANGGTDRRPFRTTPSVPGVDTILDLDGIRPQLVKEYTVGAGAMIGSRGYARADVILRNWDNFYATFRDISTGRTKDQFGTEYDLSVLRSDSDIYEREYTGVQTQFNYRVMDRLRVGGTYTWSRLVGNLTGETSGDGPVTGVAGEYPEYRQESWNYPTGYLTADQRHRARAWASYDLPSRFGDFNFSLLQNFDSGTRTSVDGEIDTRPYVTNPGYLNPPGTVSYFFSGRGALKTDDITSTNFALNYSYRFGQVELFVQPEVLNIFNEQGVQAYNEEVLTSLDSTSLKPFNPFTEKPIECPQGAPGTECAAMGAHFQRGPSFGKPTVESSYQDARTFRVSFGLRF